MIRGEIFKLIFAGIISLGLVGKISPEFFNDMEKKQTPDKVLDDLRTQYAAASRHLDSLKNDRDAKNAGFESRVLTILADGERGDSTALYQAYDSIRINNNRFISAQDSMTRVMGQIWERADSLAISRNVHRDQIWNQIKTR